MKGDLAPCNAFGLNWPPSEGDGMKKSRFSEEQIIAVLKEHQTGIPVAEICRKRGISDATFCSWRSR